MARVSLDRPFTFTSSTLLPQRTASSRVDNTLSVMLLMQGASPAATETRVGGRSRPPQLSISATAFPTSRLDMPISAENNPAKCAQAPPAQAGHGEGKDIMNMSMMAGAHITKKTKKTRAKYTDKERA
eukprot:scaffold1593_cov143-Isochrysis_galbana.AAC.2